MRAAVRKLLPRRRHSDDDSGIVRGTRYEDARARVPPTEGLRPLRGTRPPPNMAMEMQKQSIHNRSKSVPRQYHATRGPSSDIAGPIPPTAEYSSADGSRKLQKPRNGTVKPQPNGIPPLRQGREPSRSIDHSSLQNRPRGASVDLVDAARKHYDPGVPARVPLYTRGGEYQQDFDRRNGSKDEVSSISSRDMRSSSYSYVATVYSEDVADRNIAAEREAASLSNLGSSRSSLDIQGYDGPLGGPQDSPTGRRSHVRAVPQFSHAGMYDLEDGPQTPPKDPIRSSTGSDGTPQRMFSISRKPLGRNSLESNGQDERSISQPNIGSTTRAGIGRNPPPVAASLATQRRHEKHAQELESLHKALAVTRPSLEGSVDPIHAVHGNNNTPRVPSAPSQRSPVAAKSTSSRVPAPIAGSLPIRHRNENTARDPNHKYNELTAEKQSLDGIVDLKNSVHTDTHTTQAPAVTHETVQPTVHEIRTEEIHRDIHTHTYFHHLQPIVDVEVRPTRHYIPDSNGNLAEVPISSIPGRTDHFRVVETASDKGAPKPLPAPPREPYVESSVTYRTPEGFDRTETVIRHPPVILSEDGGEERPWPFPLPANEHEHGTNAVAPAYTLAPERSSSLQRIERVGK